MEFRASGFKLVLFLCWCLIASGTQGFANEQTPSFLDDVIPVLTRFGCNSGGCHGKLSGQNGFRLSLRGFAPQQDFESIAKETFGRRVSPAAPARSLLIQKSIGTLPHGGGQRFEADSRAAKILEAWIQAGMPGPATDESTLLSLSIESNPEVSLLKPGQSVSLSALATYADGTRRDVTWLTSFASGDPAVIEVTEAGKVTALNSGETVIRASFRDLVEIQTFTVPFDNKVGSADFLTHYNPIDRPVFEKLKSLNLEPSALCDDLTFLRRASLDATGIQPTPDEVRKFLANPNPDKRAQLVESLLDKPEFVDYWTHWLADLLQNRKERDHDVRGSKGVRSFHAWLRQQVQANRSWKDITEEVLTSKGLTDDSPTVGYFIVTVGEREAEQSEVADSVAQAFLGTRIGCAKCHNHPLEKYTQDDYYHFIGFFSRVALQRQSPESGPTELVVGTRHLLNLRKELQQQRQKLSDLNATQPESTTPDGAQVQGVQQRISELERQIEENLNRTVEVRQPRTGKMLRPQPLDRTSVEIAAGADPRETLVEWMTEPTNEAFSGAMVNRLWKHFLGVGLVEPVDDLRATNPPSNQELWNILVHEFVSSDYDMKHVMRLIMNSRTYQLSAATTPGNFRDRQFYSHFQARRLPAEVLLDAICFSTGEPESFAGYPRGVRAIQIPDPFTDSYFLTMFGRAPRTTACACERENDVTLPQLLHLQNSEELSAKVKSQGGRLASLLSQQLADEQLVEEIYLATLCRLPLDHEVQPLMRLFQNANRNEVAADLFWALLNTAEFAFNH